jgi:hypothetical protein
MCARVQLCVHCLDAALHVLHTTDQLEVFVQGGHGMIKLTAAEVTPAAGVIGVTAAVTAAAADA